jgi:hypothetical protein
MQIKYLHTDETLKSTTSFLKKADISSQILTDKYESCLKELKLEQEDVVKKLGLER